MAYKNPIPHVDDEFQSRQVYLSFTFNEPVTVKEAARSLTELFTENPVITPEQLVLIGDVTMRYKLPQDYAADDADD